MKFIKLLLLGITLLFAWLSPMQAAPIAQLPTPAAQQRETTSLSSSQEVLTIASFNVENLDPSDRRFDDIAKIIVKNLKSPDIIALEEVQDDNGSTDDKVVDADLTYQTLIDAITKVSGPNYSFLDIAPIDDQDGGEPGGNIRVGFLFQSDRVPLVNLTKGGSLDAVAIRKGQGGPDLSLNPGRIDPTNNAFDESRKPIAAEFLFNDQKLFVIANHLVSKRGGPEKDAQRVDQAKIINQFVTNLLKSDQNANVIVLGDLNDTQNSLPLKTLKGILKNLPEQLPLDDQYSFKFGSKLELIDHLLVSDHLSRAAQPEIDMVRVNIGFKKPVSDHDPVLAAFTLPANQPNPASSSSSSSTAASRSAILPQLSDSALVAQLAKDYTPSKVLSYDQAKDTMFGTIDNQGGTVTDIYASFSITLAGPGDPSKEADKLGLNTEHVWPQSKGAGSGGAQSDIHHLFPARENINSERGNKPFGDIPNASTEKWFRGDTVLSTTPTNAINEYSELSSSSFEPRESVKGDIARAMLYFKTIYRDQANSIEPGYFSKQSRTLCKWNQQDPPDDAEIERSHAIAQHQGNENPFVLDLTLAERSFCG